MFHNNNKTGTGVTYVRAKTVYYTTRLWRGGILKLVETQMRLTRPLCQGCGTATPRNCVGRNCDTFATSRRAKPASYEAAAAQLQHSGEKKTISQDRCGATARRKKPSLAAASWMMAIVLTLTEYRSCPARWNQELLKCDGSSSPPRDAGVS